MSTAQQRQALGAYGETLALHHLQAAGMVLLDRNWRCDVGEIDLVLRDGNALVICEVKTRSSNDYGSPFEAVTTAKLSRLHVLAARWAEEHGVRPRDVRVDLVGVIRGTRGPAVIDHVRGVA